MHSKDTVYATSHVTTDLMFLLHNKRDDRLRQHPAAPDHNVGKLAIATRIYRRSDGAQDLSRWKDEDSRKKTLGIMK
jgi:hypothetical protein